MIPFRAEPNSALDARSRELMLHAAHLLRSATPKNGELEVCLHDIARLLERIATVSHRGAPERGYLALRRQESRTVARGRR
mgnify:CR=1 FL=1